MEKERLFELKSITKTYGATVALKDLSITIGVGEVVGLIGANGAGKSTLTRIVSGVTVPDAGQLFHEGRPVNQAAYTPAATIDYCLLRMLSLTHCAS